MPYCKDCGAEIKDLSQNFCEKCGSPIPDSVRQGQTAPTQPTPAVSRVPPSSRPGGLFDINRNYYILKEKFKELP